MLSSKEKIIKYLNYKGISQDKFSRACNVSSGFLRQGKSFSIEYLKSIRDNYSDLNLNWLIYDEGNMLLSGENEVNEHPETYQKEAGTIELLKKDVENLEKLLESKNETIAVLKHQLGINNNGNSQSKAS